MVLAGRLTSSQGRRLLGARLCVLGVLALGLVGLQPAAAQTQVYYNITGLKTEQLNNAVRVKIEADGTIAADIYRYWPGGAESDYYLDWRLVEKQTGAWQKECFPQVDRIRFHLTNACPKLGSVASVDRYPVSHVRFITTQEGNGAIGLDVEVVLRKRMRFRYFKLTNMDTWDAYMMDHHDPDWFEVVLSPDQRSVIVTVASDRLPERPERRRLADVPEAQREVQVHADGSRLTVHARAAALGDVVEAVTQAAGIPVVALPEVADRVVTAELPQTTAEEFTARLADCYGLARYRNGETVVLADASPQTGSAQGALAAARLPLRFLKARTAADLLPNFLADAARIDEEANALLVTGSESVLAKVAADLAEIDTPASGVRVTATILESASSREALSRLHLMWQREGLRAETAPEEGGVFYSTLGALPEEFTAKLQELATEAGLKVAGQTSVTITSGETGEIFAGLDRYLLHYLTEWDPEPKVEPVSAGATLTVTPWAGEHTISLRVSAEVRSIEEVDPVTRLPVVRTRASSGLFRAASGETLVIGGLKQEQESVTVRRLPVLGSLPLVGRLFRTTRKQRTATESTILLTATLTAAERPAGTPSAPAVPAPPHRPGIGVMKRW